MESLISNKVLLFGFIIILVINAIYKPQLPTLVKKVLNNAVFKIALITYLTFSSNYTIEFSLIVAVTVLTVLEMVREIEHFEVTDDKTDNKNTDDKSNKTNSSQPNIPMVTGPSNVTSTPNTPTSPPSNNTIPTVAIKEIDSTNTVNNSPPKTDSIPKPPSTPTALQSNGMVTGPSQASSSPTGVTSNLGLSNNNSSNQPANKDDSDQTFVNKDKNTNTNTPKASTSSCKPTVPKPVIDAGEETVARFMINTASVDLSGNCEVSNYPKKVSLSIGNYKIYDDESNEIFRIPSLLALYNKKEKGVTSEINLLVKKGFKVTFVSKNGSKTFFGATTNEDGYYLESDVISKALLDFVELNVEPI